MFGSNQRPPMPRFAATYLPFFAAKSVCIGVYPWLKTGSVAAPLPQVFSVFRGSAGYFRVPMIRIAAWKASRQSVERPIFRYSAALHVFIGPIPV